MMNSHDKIPDHARPNFVLSDNAIQEILDMRGTPYNCDFCGKPEKPDKLYPEEAGDFACEDCMKKWGEL